MKNIRVFYLKIFSFLEVKFSIYFNRRVIVMDCQQNWEITYFQVKVIDVFLSLFTRNHTQEQ